MQSLLAPNFWLATAMDVTCPALVPYSRGAVKCYCLHVLALLLLAADGLESSRAKLGVPMCRALVPIDTRRARDAARLWITLPAYVGRRRDPRVPRACHALLIPPRHLLQGMIRSTGLLHEVAILKRHAEPCVISAKLRKAAISALSCALRRARSGLGLRWPPFSLILVDRAFLATAEHLEDCHRVFAR